MRKHFLCFKNKSPQKTSFIFSKESLSYTSGNENPKKLLIFQEVSKNYKNPFLKCLLYFGKWNFLAPNLKEKLYISEETCKACKSKKIILVFKHKRKRKKFLMLFLTNKQNFLNYNKVLFLILQCFFSIPNQFSFFIF